MSQTIAEPRVAAPIPVPTDRRGRRVTRRLGGQLVVVLGLAVLAFVAALEGPVTTEPVTITSTGPYAPPVLEAGPITSSGPYVPPILGPVGVTSTNPYVG